MENKVKKEWKIARTKENKVRRQQAIVRHLAKAKARHLRNEH
jgi:energy-converting hydrogenase Eha subunit H